MKKILFFLTISFILSVFFSCSFQTPPGSDEVISGEGEKTENNTSEKSPTEGTEEKNESLPTKFTHNGREYEKVPSNSGKYALMTIRRVSDKDILFTELDIPENGKTISFDEPITFLRTKENDTLAIKSVSMENDVLTVLFDGNENKIGISYRLYIPDKELGEFEAIKENGTFIGFKYKLTSEGYDAQKKAKELQSIKETYENDDLDGSKVWFFVDDYEYITEDFIEIQRKLHADNSIFLTFSGFDYIFDIENEE